MTISQLAECPDAPVATAMGRVATSIPRQMEKEATRLALTCLSGMYRRTTIITCVDNDSTVVHTVRNMFHMFHGLITLWNIYVEHDFVITSHQILARMFQCSIKNRTCVRLTVDRCSLFFNFVNQKVLEHMEHFPFIQ